VFVWVAILPLLAGVKLVTWIEPYNVKYIADEKSVYASMLIA